jgi:hypothetical protein
MGEHVFSCVESNDGIRLQVKPKDMPVVDFDLNPIFEGKVYTDFNGTRECIGTAKPAKKETA